jgi:hypothetical protein
VEQYNGKVKLAVRRRNNRLKDAMKHLKNVLGGKRGNSMRKTMVLITIGGWLLAGAAFAVDGGEKTSSTAGTAESRAFNVLEYGAMGDDKTDNTEAFSACLKAVIAAGGGKMYLPDGVYNVQASKPTHDTKG